MGSASTAPRHAAYRLDLVSAVAERLGMDQDSVDDVVVATLEEVIDRLLAGDQVVLRGFGVFEARRMKPVTRQKPATGEPVEVPARTRPRFRPSRSLTARLNGEHAPDDLR